MSEAAPVTLSVVIATHNASETIGACLNALQAQKEDDCTELIVADSSTDETSSVVRRFPGVKLLHFAQPLTVPELRGRGIAAAGGDIIAILDPFSIADEGWVSAVLAAHASCAGTVIGGAVGLYDAENQGLLAWAQYINEYGSFMPPIQGGPTDIVPGCNVSYKRSALFDDDRPRFDAFWKTFVNWGILSAGESLHLAPEVFVSLRKPVPFTNFLVSRFDHGRCFAAMRVAEMGWCIRLARAATAPVVPGVLLWRWVRAYWGKRRMRRKLVATLPLQLLLFGAWGAGEGWGYLLGAGRSCRRLFY